MKNMKVLLVVAFIIVAGLVLSLYSYQNRRDLDYNKSLDLTVVCVDGKEITLRDMTYYIVKQELAVEEQARVYDLENTNSYWGVRLNRTGGFVKLEAKQAVMEAVIHDEIFYQMAQAQGITLSDEEAERLTWMQYDFWADLEDEQADALGVTKQEVDAVMERIALAEKYQMIYTLQNNPDSEYYDVGGEGYALLLQEHEYKVDESVWNRVPFGNVILEHTVREDATEKM